MPIKKEISFDDILSLKEQGKTNKEISIILNCNERSVYRRLEKLNDPDKDVLNQNVKLAKQKQKLQDLNRIERKSFREHARLENALIEYNKELIKVIKENKVKDKVTKFNYKPSQPVGIIHITDTHFNENVDLNMNKYDFNVAAQRLKLLAEKSKVYFNGQNVKKVVIACTGDILNSDRRLDEILVESTNRSKATFLAVYLLRQFILDLSRDYNVVLANVVGNESRVTKDFGWTDEVATDNYDYTIYNILKLLFENTGVEFTDGDPIENIIEVANQKILLIHGNSIKASSMEQSIQKIKGKYTSRGINIDFILLGHYHCCRISDTFARGSSLVGSNSYSDSALQLEGRASQNIHIFYSDKTRDSIKIDLQNVNNVKGYEVQEKLKAYNVKAIHKAKKKVIIHRILG